MIANDGPLRLMAVHAHPDDESSKGAAAMARYVAEGVAVLVVTCTGGERGDVLNPKLKGDPEVEANLPEYRPPVSEEQHNVAFSSGPADGSDHSVSMNCNRSCPTAFVWI